MGATVLVIEDYSAHRALLHTVVGRMGCTAVDAVDGRSGLELAKQHQPALIVLDLILPDLDGLEVLRRLRQDPQTESTPILIVSAVETHERVVAALDSGADDYVTKPFDSAVLQARMKVLLRAARLQRDLLQRADEAEATARLARAAAGDEVADVAQAVCRAMRLDGIGESRLFLLRDDRLCGPYGVPGVAGREQALVTLLQHGGLGRALCGEVPWQRLTRAELALLAADLDAAEAVAVPLLHGRRPVGLVILAAHQGSLREVVLRRVQRLTEPAALALATAIERAGRTEHELRYRLLFEQATDGVAILDPSSGACREVNQALAGWLSAVPAALAGRPFAALFEAETASNVVEAVSAAAFGQRVSLDGLRLAAGDAPIPVEVGFRRLRHEGGGEIVAVVRDLRSREAVGRFERAHADLGKLARTVRALNHEINNPLTCIIGLTQLMQLKLKDAPEAMPQLERILDSAEQISAFSKQLREVAILLGGEQPLAAVEAALDELARHAG
ncbi:MAG: response regulator [Fimbriimonadaceae bacterium]|nr:response regulator [Fimbriimonadaceae bacterium]